MNEFVVHGSVSLERGGVLRIEDGCDLLVYVWEGGLWLTQEGEARDRYIGTGGWFRLDRDGIAVGTATGRTSLTVTSPRPEGYARRVSLSRRRGEPQVELYAAPGRAAGFWARLFAPHARPTTAAL